MKRCSRCKETKELSEFGKNKLMRDGLHYYCRSCTRGRPTNAANTRAYALRHPNRKLVQYAKARARKKGIEFDLTYDDIEIPEKCPVLGIPLQIHIGCGKAGAKQNSPTIDRIDNSKGYVRGNVIVISYRANHLKMDASIEELCLIADFYRNALKSSREDSNCMV